MKITKITLAILGACLGLAGSALAGETTVYQKGKAFSVDTLTLSGGDTILFINDDNVAHNVFVSQGSKKIDLGLQKPGEQGKLALDPGKYTVRCAIHPKMKLSVLVE